MTKQEKWLNGDDLTASEVQEILGNTNTLKNGVLVLYSLMSEYDVRRSKAVERYREFASSEDAEAFLSTLKDRNGKFEYGKMFHVGDYIVSNVSDYKGDYSKTVYYYGQGMYDLIDRLAAEQMPKKEEEKYWVVCGEIFTSKEKALSYPNANPSDVVCVSGMDAAKIEEGRQYARILNGTYGD